MSTGQAPSSAKADPEPLAGRDSWLFSNRGKLHPLCALVAVALALPTVAGLSTGLALLAAWLILRVWAVRHIGGAARVHARKARTRKQLITTGPFALVRNPLYVANILGLSGTCLVLGPAWFAALAGLAALAWYAAVVRWEESILSEQYGAEYREYRQNTPWLLPSPKRLAQGDLGTAVLPLSKALRRERGLGVLLVVVMVLALAKWQAVG